MDEADPYDYGLDNGESDHDDNANDDFARFRKRN